MQINNALKSLNYKENYFLCVHLTTLKFDSNNNSKGNNNDNNKKQY